MRALDPAHYPSLDYEMRLWTAGYQHVAGLDEAGRGALAGPVCAAAVTLPADPSLTQTLREVRDSKLMTALSRQAWAPVIQANALGWGIGYASAQEIDSLGIVPATKLAGMRALAQLSLSPLSPSPLSPDYLLPDYLLPVSLFPDYLFPDYLFPDYLSPVSLFPDYLFPLSLLPDYLLTDYLVFPELELPQTALVKGDRLSLSVAAASVLAKTARDAWMRELDVLDPTYGFARHKGYGTQFHQQAIRRFGLSQNHRKSFSISR